MTWVNVWALLGELQAVDYVVIGSGARLLLGENVAVNDLDICPRIDRANLESITQVLDRIGAAPRGPRQWDHLYGHCGDAREASLSELEWRVGNSYLTPMGLLDVVPRPGGVHGIEQLRSRYEQLIDGTHIVQNGDVAVQCVGAAVLTRSARYA